MAQKPRRKGSKKRILTFLLANMGRIIEGSEIRAASGNASEWARRVRELRDEEGYQIYSHRDRAELKPGQYLIETDQRLPAFPREISKETRAYPALFIKGSVNRIGGISALYSSPDLGACGAAPVGEYRSRDTIRVYE